jgi:hypothetical protein
MAFEPNCCKAFRNGCGDPLRGASSPLRPVGSLPNARVRVKTSVYRGSRANSK